MKTNLHLHQLRKNSINRLVSAGIDAYEARAEVDLFLEHFLGFSPQQTFLTQEVSCDTSAVRQLENALRERVETRKPVQYIMGRAYFFGLSFEVNQHVLIPRIDTEILVEKVLQKLQDIQSPFIADIGTGSGAICISVLKNHATSLAIGTDISQHAIAVSAFNAARHKIQDRLTLIRTKYLDKVEETFDLIVSNPPYIPAERAKWLMPEIVNHEPPEALFVKDDDPLIHYTHIADQALQKLKARGNLVVEVDDEFAEDVQSLFISKGYEEVMVIEDLNNKARVVTAIKN
jgi:release factor glutamine methyltransferase